MSSKGVWLGQAMGTPRGAVSTEIGATLAPGQVCLIGGVATDQVQVCVL